MVVVIFNLSIFSKMKNSVPIYPLSIFCRRSTKLLVITKVTALLMIFCTDANASLVTFNFKGSVNQVSNELSEEFSVGDTFTGFYTFESTTTNATETEVNRGLYIGAITDFSLKIGSYSATASKGEIFIANNLAGIDEYQVNVNTADHGLSGLNVNGYDLFFFQLFVNDSNQAAIGSTELPLTPPKLGNFNDGILRIGFIRPGDKFVPQVSVFNFQTNGSLTLAPVPLPAALWLFICAFTCLLGFNKASQQSAKY